MAKPRFKRIYVEIGNICNKACTFCPKTTRTLRQMSVDEYTSILDKIHGYTEHVYLHVMGEPLIHRDLATFLDIAEKHGLNVNITTNGTKLSENIDILQHKSIRKISISVHSFEANSMDIPLKEYLSNIVDFANTVGKDKIVELRLWNIYSKNYSKLNNDIIDYICDSFSFDEKIDIEVKTNYNIKDHIYLMFAKEFDWPSMEGEYFGDIGYCHALKDQIAILVNGDVVPCCLDNNGSMVLGNIHRDSMDTILSSPRATAIYQGFRNRCRVEELCKRCEYATRFDK